ncbi:MAG: ImmA/IrrE family metallo-endopeptidase [Candidatus Dehalobacter alkaniphilus]|uniref:ImmA/IrrE family metallo-endopeptidase n=2 Tax=unclassified Dehalobacter TaxID=2635733 RepID=UPI001FA8057D|nr:ImmA/IrrE family metallo-endopeptidase [Dehalobacter sp. DCA]
MKQLSLENLLKGYSQMHSKKIPDKLRYNRTLSIAQKFILEQNINRLPVDPFKLTARIDLPIVSASEYAMAMNCSFQHVIRDIIKSNDGTAKCVDNMQFIIYNERVASKGRIRWTLLHEIGHVRLGHLIDFEETRVQRAGLTKTEYEVLEKEADCFASRVLAPPIVLEALKVDNATRLITLCGLSRLAAENRYKDFSAKLNKRRFPDLLEIKIERNFHDFIHKKYCVICGHSFVIENAKYCPICGKKRVYWGDGKMIYSGYELDDKSKAKVCPRCENEETSLDGEHCIICGSHLVNRCTNDDNENNHSYEPCGILLPGNARYCYKCGSQSTFLSNKILRRWSESQADEQVASTHDNFGDIPF